MVLYTQNIVSYNIFQIASIFYLDHLFCAFAVNYYLYYFRDISIWIQYLCMRWKHPQIFPRHFEIEEFFWA